MESVEIGILRKGLEVDHFGLHTVLGTRDKVYGVIVEVKDGIEFQ